jgi:hypothetical protein
VTWSVKIISQHFQERMFTVYISKWRLWLNFYLFVKKLWFLSTPLLFCSTGICIGWIWKFWGSTNCNQSNGWEAAVNKDYPCWLGIQQRSYPEGHEYKVRIYRARLKCLVNFCVNFTGYFIWSTGLLLITSCCFVLYLHPIYNWFMFQYLSLPLFCPEILASKIDCFSFAS